MTTGTSGAHDQAFTHGYQTAQRWRDASDCPYGPGQKPERYAWFDGWRQGRLGLAQRPPLVTAALVRGTDLAFVATTRFHTRTGVCYATVTTTHGALPPDLAGLVTLEISSGWAHPEVGAFPGGADTLEALNAPVLRVSTLFSSVGVTMRIRDVEGETLRADIGAWGVRARCAQVTTYQLNPHVPYCLAHCGVTEAHGARVALGDAVISMLSASVQRALEDSGAWRLASAVRRALAQA